MGTRSRKAARGGFPAGYAFLGAALLLLVGFALAERTQDAVAEAAAGAPVAGVVDSIFPVEEEIRRFRVGLPEVRELSGGAASMDELVERFTRAVEAADTAALAPLLLTRAEFGYLYYPHTIYTKPPYKLSPALLWFQMENLTGRSLTRLLRRLAGRPLHAHGYHCEPEPKLEGPNRVWSECRMSLQPPASEPSQLRLFGSVVERGGVFKFVSYASEL